MAARPQKWTCRWSPKLLKRFGLGIGAGAIFLVLLVASLSLLDKHYLPPLDLPDDYSVEILDRNGELLRVFTNSEGRWRLPVNFEAVDPDFVRMLITYEDKRFYDHYGVDPLAMGRAARQLVTNGRIVSGGSTITMQLARLLEPRAKRTILAKLRQIVRAIQIEQRLSKREILELYLSLAPYGGNIEGIRAASLTWFGKEPADLAVREAAILVALPQSPESRRPDRFPKEARVARDRILERLTEAGVVPTGERQRIAELAAPASRQAMPMLAPHMARDAIDRDPLARIHETTLDRNVQQRMENVAENAARQIGKRVSVAILVADGWTGEILASVGSPGIHDTHRQGWIDMTQALRSPGSTLKPFVYGLAIEDGLVLPETMISDRPSNFGGYRPTNFDTTYQGDVSIRRALQMSLNVPAVQMLDAISPARFMARLKRAQIEPQTPDASGPGLSLVLGGASLSLLDLVQLYANLVNLGSKPILLGDGVRKQAGTGEGARLLSRVASWHVIDMLRGVREPVGSKPLPVAYKTGTSYGYRDAWSVGFDGRYVIGIWVGRPDNGAVPGITGIKTAAPILFKAFGSIGTGSTPFAEAPPGATRIARDELPVALDHFENATASQRFANVLPRDHLHIAFPADSSEIELARSIDGSVVPIVIKLQGGVPPFRLIEERSPVAATRRRELLWEPRGKGFFLLTVLDAVGQTNTVNIRLQ